jgi:type IV pilus assembly protein PilX
LVMMLLSLLLVAGSGKLGLMNERLSGNSTDYQRAYEAAEAMLADARMDLACLQAGTCGASSRATLGAQVFACDRQAYNTMLTQLSALNPPCRDGICLDLGANTSGDPATSFWNNPANWATYTSGNRGVTFGRFTGVTPTAGTAINPRLVANSWYWIEVLPYGSNEGGRSLAAEQNFIGGSTSAISPDNTQCPFVFRVTAAASGVKPGTLAVLQSMYFFRNPG